MLECVSLWIGERLGPVERACFRSVLRHGHRLTLYCYDRPKGIPEGVEVADASDILPERCVFRDKRGSVAAFSDWFRYELQRRALGTWLDADVYVLAPIGEEDVYLFGEQQPGLLNNAVLRLPADSPMLPELLEPFSATTPSWLPVRERLPSLAREWLTGRADLGAMPWGTTGPAGLSAVVRKHGLMGHAKPPRVFYPVAWEDAAWIVNPDLRPDDMITADTVAIHLWNECIKTVKDAPAPPGSFLHRLQQEGRD